MYIAVAYVVPMFEFVSPPSMRAHRRLQLEPDEH